MESALDDIPPMTLFSYDTTFNSNARTTELQRALTLELLPPGDGDSDGGSDGDADEGGDGDSDGGSDEMPPERFPDEQKGHVEWCSPPVQLQHLLIRPHD